MASSKAALKAAKAALDSHKYDDAIKEAGKVLEVDPANYHGNVFLGLALDKQGKYDEAEKAYNAALKSKANDTLAWQGLVTLYEKQANKKVDEYANASTRLAEIYMTADDKHRCQTVVDKYVGFAKQHGTRIQYKDALELMLPTSNLYDYLEGRIPHPSQTYSKVVEIVESEEKERVNKLIGERRTRLGAKIGQVTVEVKREVFEGSKLEYLYGCAIDWTNEDDIRRLYEERLLQRAYDTLVALPIGDKADKRKYVQKLADGMVIIKHPFALAWKIVLEWRDVEQPGDWDVGLLREYIGLFPEDGLAKVLRAYLESEISPFPQLVQDEKDPEDDEDPVEPLSAEDRLILMTSGVEESSRCHMSQRLMGQYFLHLEEYENAVENSKAARELLVIEKQTSGLELQNVLDGINIVLGTALVQYQTPRNHSQARELFDSVLKRKPTNTSALIGVGLILEEEDDYNGAVNFLSRALEGAPDPKVKAEASWCKALNGDYSAALGELQECLEEVQESDDLQSRELRSLILYRIGMCMWNLDSSRAARKDRTGSYAKFLAALQLNLNYAPAYTMLGIFYSDYGKDKKRARKCFQKAFELSASEVEAAERLAKAFAGQGEWDLVEVVATRVVDSGKVWPPPGSKKKGISWPFAALGVCQLNSLDYFKSIVSFQSALKISPENFHYWVGLGESYHNSGRYVAATKVFEQALKLEKRTETIHPKDTWFSKYMLANVRRELGEYEEAVTGYCAVLETKPDEYGVNIALLQAYVENSWHCIQLGLFGRAADNANQVARIARSIVKSRPNAFNLWKGLGDACACYSWVEEYGHTHPIDIIQDMLQDGAEPEMFEQLADIDGVDSGTLQHILKEETPLRRCLLSAILAHKRALYCCSSDLHAQAVAWYNLGWTEYRCHVSLSNIGTQSSKKNFTKHLKASIRCFKRAIELEAGNTEFWNSLGIVTTVVNPKVAQHAFVRSLHLNDKSAKTWANLGTLYLFQNDTELANEAFTRSQSTDPDYAHAWLGQGILAVLLGEIKEAQNLFAHAFEISDSTSLMVKRLYTTSTFDLLSTIERRKGTQILEFLQPLFALNQLKSQAPSNMVFQHLFSLVSERAGDHSSSVESLNSICSRLESEFEESESPETMTRFAQAKADLARNQLASGELDLAIGNAETALDLSADEETGKFDASARSKYRLSAHLTAGLAYSYTEDLDKAIEMFRVALEESDGNPDVISLLAQVLWAKGTEQEQNVAREQLFDCVEHNPTHVGSIMLLAVIAMLDEDRESLEAVTTDLYSLRTREDIDEKQKYRIGEIIAAIVASQEDNGRREDEEIAEATTAVMLAPSQPHGWSQLASVASKDNLYPAEIALLTAMNAVPPKGTLDPEDLSKAYSGTNRPADAQCAVMLAPWMASSWEGLAF